MPTRTSIPTWTGPPDITPKRVNVDFPTWMVQGLDHEAERLGITRQALIKTWIAERLKA